MGPGRAALFLAVGSGPPGLVVGQRPRARADRKSTRLNSSHSQISYAVFCLKKKKSEYLDRVAARADGTKPYQYSSFCELYCAWRSRFQPSISSFHRPGEKAFFDYSCMQPTT